MINFKSIKLKNFLSTGNTFESLSFQPGIHLVTGYNYDELRPNGAGKSGVLVDSIIYSLFGTPLRKIRKENLVNNINESELVVDIEFVSEGTRYKISRGEFPKFCNIEVNGTEKNQQNINKAKQDITNNILKANKEVYKHLLVLSVDYSNPFLRLYAHKKRELVEYLLGISVYGDMYDVANERLNEAKMNVNSLENEIEMQKNHLADLMDSFHSISEHKREHKQSVLANLNNIKQNYNNLKKRNKNIQLKINKQSTIERHLDKYKQKRDELEEKKIEYENKRYNNISKIDEKKGFLKTIKTESICPFCGKKLDDENGTREHKKKLKKAIREVKQQKRQIEHQLKEINKKISKIDGKMEDLHDTLNKINEYKSEKESNIEKIDELEKKWKKIKHQKDDYNGIIDKEKLENLKKSLKENEEKLEKSSTNKFYYSFITSILSDNGVKQYIIGKFIPFLNRKVNTYLEELGAEFTVQFENQLEVTIKKKNRDVMQYDNLSGGEKKRLDIAVQLGLNNLAQLQNNVATNLLVFDEILDSSLDADGISKLMSLLYSFAHDNNMCIYLITHREELKNESIFESIINMEKRNGFTSINIEKGE